MTRTIRLGCLVAAVAVLVAATPLARAAERHRSALDEPVRRDAPRRYQHVPLRADRDAPPPGDAPPVPVVLRFLHISAESFMDTVGQLGENDFLHEMIQQLPMALNEEANAVVVIGPPEVVEVIARVAHEIDQPNEFQVHRREREREELEFRHMAEKQERALDIETQQQHLRLDAARRHVAGPPMPMPGMMHGRGMMPGRGPGAMRGRGMM